MTLVEDEILPLSEREFVDLQGTFEVYLRQMDIGIRVFDASAKLRGIDRAWGWRYESWTEWEMEWTLDM